MDFRDLNGVITPTRIEERLGLNRHVTISDDSLYKRMIAILGWGFSSVDREELGYIEERQIKFLVKWIEF